MANPVRIGVVGTGSMGRHHSRILAALPGADLVGVYDISRERAEAVATEHGTRVFSGLDELAARVEAAVVSVPTVHHAEVGCRLLTAGRHVLVEKPVAPTLEEADRLLEAAADRVLAVGHVEFHNPAVQALLALGSRPRFVEVHRLGVFTLRSLDIDVILDLMIHDLQILHALDPSPVVEIRATGVNVLSSRIDITNVRLALESGCVANLTASRVSAEKVRKLRAFLPNSYYSVDYGEQEVKGYRLEEHGEERRIVPSPLQVEPCEPLRRELEAFVAVCRGQEVALVSGAEGRRALQTALSVVEAIEPVG